MICYRLKSLQVQSLENSIRATHILRHHQHELQILLLLNLDQVPSRAIDWSRQLLYASNHSTAHPTKYEELPQRARQNCKQIDWSKSVVRDRVNTSADLDGEHWKLARQIVLHKFLQFRPPDHDLIHRLNDFLQQIFSLGAAVGFNAFNWFVQFANEFNQLVDFQASVAKKDQADHKISVVEKGNENCAHGLVEVIQKPIQRHSIERQEENEDFHWQSIFVQFQQQAASND